jgi:hypothetical protein
MSRERRVLNSAARLSILIASMAGTSSYAASTTVFEYDGAGNLLRVSSVASDGGSCLDGTTCPSGHSCCGGACVDLTSSTTHCGACGTACAAPVGGFAVCSDSRCLPGECFAPSSDCAGVCRNVSFDTEHCGACGSACPVAANAVVACVDSQCGFVCDPGYEACGDGCASLSSDPSNCGACRRVCPGVAGGQATCVNGSCAAACDDVTDVLCPSGPAAFVCVDVNSGPGACGSCGAECGGTECVVAPWAMVRVEEDGDRLVGHLLQECSALPSIHWPPPPTCTAGFCW